MGTHIRDEVLYPPIEVSVKTEPKSDFAPEKGTPVSLAEFEHDPDLD